MQKPINRLATLATLSADENYASACRRLAVLASRSAQHSCFDSVPNN